MPLERYFPEYQGGPDVNKAAKYILWRFTQLNRQRLSIYPHLTQATDTSNVRLALSSLSLLALALDGAALTLDSRSQIRLVFAAVKETILQNALRDSGII